MQGIGQHRHPGFPELRLQGTWALGEQVLVKETGRQSPSAPNVSSVLQVCPPHPHPAPEWHCLPAPWPWNMSMTLT